jgi:hypothetical protein
MYGDRLEQMDLRIAKDFSFQRGTRAQMFFDLYNLFNGNTTLGQNNTFGPLWQNPTAFLGARQAKVGFLLRF